MIITHYSIDSKQTTLHPSTGLLTMFTEKKIYASEGFVLFGFFFCFFFVLVFFLNRDL